MSADVHTKFAHDATMANRLASADAREGAISELAMRGLNLHRVVPVSVRGEYVVHIDGRPYAAFRDAKAAEEARDAWARSWPAVQGRTLTVGGA